MTQLLQVVPLAYDAAAIVCKGLIRKVTGNLAEAAEPTHNISVLEPLMAAAVICY